jgi:hypothetical protein
VQAARGDQGLGRVYDDSRTIADETGKIHTRALEPIVSAIGLRPKWRHAIGASVTDKVDTKALSLPLSEKNIPAVWKCKDRAGITNVEP